MPDVYERVRDSELSPEVLAEKERRQRIYEINAVVFNGVRKGVPVERLLDTPNGLLGPGSCKRLNEDIGKERAFIIKRYNAMLSSHQRGHLADDYKRKLEGNDTTPGVFVGWARQNGVERMLTEDAQRARLEADTKQVIETLNKARIALGLSEITLS